MISRIFFKNSILRVIAIVIFLCGTAITAESVDSSITFRDVTDETGITFRHFDGSSGNYYLIESVASGLALFDYDNDGDTDIYFLNGAAMKGTKYKVPPRNALYRNDGNFKFTDVTKQSGLGDTGFGLGVTVGDIDNDGDLDLYLNNYGPNVLFSNNGDGTFTDITKKAGVGNGDYVGAGACFLDMDKDGDLDLYVSRYVMFSYEKHIQGNIGGFPTYTFPTIYPFSSDSLYRNNGDGTFTDVSKASGIAKQQNSGMGVICADYDNDGDTDIFVANDLMEDYLLRNDGKGNFEQVGLMSGIAYDLRGKGLASMGVDCADYDNDGLLDFYVTSYSDESAILHRNIGDGLFEDATFAAGAGSGTYNSVTWGTGFVDFDNDGDRDIFVATGDIRPSFDRTYAARNEVLMNTGDGKFVNITDRCGDGLKVKRSSRGANFADLDNDGDIDVVILNSRERPTILRNDSVNNNHWIQIRLKGVKTNRNAVGARVKVVCGDLVQIDEVHSGRSYQGHHGFTLHFGLGGHKKVDRIEVSWIGGGVDIVTDIEPDKSITIVEGVGIEK